MRSLVRKKGIDPVASFFFRAAKRGRWVMEYLQYYMYILPNFPKAQEGNIIVILRTSHPLGK